MKPLVLAGLLLATGCVQSVSPPYTKETLTDKPALAGTWGEVSFQGTEATSEPDAERTTYVLKRLGKGHYFLCIQKGEKGGPNTSLFEPGRDVSYWDVRVFKLGDAVYLDAVRDVSVDDGPTLHALALHTVFRIDVDERGLRMRACDAGALQKRLAKSKIAYLEDDDHLQSILNAPTGRVQKFLEEHGEAVFTDKISRFFKRIDRK